MFVVEILSFGRFLTSTATSTFLLHFISHYDIAYVSHLVNACLFDFYNLLSCDTLGLVLKCQFELTCHLVFHELACHFKLACCLVSCEWVCPLSSPVAYLIWTCPPNFFFIFLKFCPNLLLLPLFFSISLKLQHILYVSPLHHLFSLSWILRILPMFPHVDQPDLVKRVL